MKDYKKIYYEQSEFWSEDLASNPDEKKRLEETLKIIPNDIRTILDVGCGNGFLINSLSKDKYKRLVGFDYSSEALKYVKTQKLLGNISSLPFENESFDLAACLETIEHLPEDDFSEGITELQRVAKKYIIISVPNEEILENSLVKCPECCCCFNPDFHMRSFNKEKMVNLFEDFRIVKLKEIGPEVKMCSYPSFLAMFRFYYYNWKSFFPKEYTFMCPQCNYQFRNRKVKKECTNTKIKHAIWKIIFHLFNFLGKIFYGSKKKVWLIALYKKNDK